jgi:hypothetical protein
MIDGFVIIISSSSSSSIYFATHKEPIETHRKLEKNGTCRAGPDHEATCVPFLFELSGDVKHSCQFNQLTPQLVQIEDNICTGDACRSLLIALFHTVVT